MGLIKKLAKIIGLVAHPGGHSGETMDFFIYQLDKISSI